MTPRKYTKPKRYPTPTPYSSRTNPKKAVCPECKRKILVGLFDARPRKYDPQHLSLLGELDAHLQGLETWWLFEVGPYRRDAYAISTSPNGLGGLVVRDHNCALPQPFGRALKAQRVELTEPGF